MNVFQEVVSLERGQGLARVEHDFWQELPVTSGHAVGTFEAGTEPGININITIDLHFPLKLASGGSQMFSWKR